MIVPVTSRVVYVATSPSQASSRPHLARIPGSPKAVVDLQAGLSTVEALARASTHRPRDGNTSATLKILVNENGKLEFASVS